jgi:hypothetical protein
VAKSYRQPYIKDGYKSKWKSKAKQFANRAVRNCSELPNGSAFKKCFNSWDICDYIFYVDEPKYRRK